MSIRINKVMGYALTDVAEDDPRLAVTRADLDTDLKGPLTRMTVGDLTAWAATLPKDDPDHDNARTLRMMGSMYRERRQDVLDSLLIDHVHWGHKESTPGMLLFVPPSFSERWYRRDDDLDYYTERLSGAGDDGGHDNKVQELPCCIHPYNAPMHRLTGRAVRLDGDPITWSWIENDLRVAREQSASGKGHEGSDYLTALGFASVDDFLVNCVPEVPMNLRLMLRFMGFLRDPATALALRPTMWTYWI